MLFETVLKQGGWQLRAAVTCLTQGSNSKQERKKSAIITVLSLLIYIWLYRLQLFCMRSRSFNIIREQRRNALQLSVMNKQQLQEDVSVALEGTVIKIVGLCCETHRRKNMLNTQFIDSVSNNDILIAELQTVNTNMLITITLTGLRMLLQCVVHSDVQLMTSRPVLKF